MSLRIQILGRLDDPIDLILNPHPYADALRAVLDKCQELRNDRSGVTGESSPVGNAVALTFEQVIADALGITEL